MEKSARMQASQNSTAAVATVGQHKPVKLRHELERCFVYLLDELDGIEMALPQVVCLCEQEETLHLLHETRLHAIHFFDLYIS